MQGDMNIPEGWALVPVDPTYQMCEEMGLKWESGTGFPIRYKAMLTAAPTPPENDRQAEIDALQTEIEAYQQANIAFAGWHQSLRKENNHLENEVVKL